MKLESEFEGLMVFLAIVFVSISAGISMAAFYHYGYYEGRSDVLDKQVCVPRVPAK